MTEFLLTQDAIMLLIGTELHYGFVREVKPNDSPEIRQFQKTTGNAPPDPWCMSFQVYCALKVWADWPYKRTGSCQQFRTSPLVRPLLSDHPSIGAIGLLIDRAADHAHHAFLVTSDAMWNGRFSTFEGNTNPTGGREGYGCFPRARGGKADPLLYTFFRPLIKAA